METENINALDTKTLLRAEAMLNKNSNAFAFAFDRPKDWDKMSQEERENVFRKIDGLPPLRVPVAEPKKRSKATSNTTKRYI